MQLPVMNENESYEVEELSSTSPLSSATAVNQNNKQQWKLYFDLFVIATYSLFTTKRTQVMYATILLIKFWLQYCYSYTESYMLIIIIIYQHGTCELIKNHYYAVLIMVFPTHKKGHKQV